MRTITYEEITPTMIPNTTMEKLFRDGIHRQYRITPNEGYVLHNNVRDWTNVDEETGEEKLYLGYSKSMSTCPANYDFAENSREFYAVPVDSVPAEQIF